MFPEINFEPYFASPGDTESPEMSFDPFLVDSDTVVPETEIDPGFSARNEGVDSFEQWSESQPLHLPLVDEEEGVALADGEHPPEWYMVVPETPEFCESGGVEAPADTTLGSEITLCPADPTIGSENRRCPADATLGSEITQCPEDPTVGSESPQCPADTTLDDVSPLWSEEKKCRYLRLLPLLVSKYF